MADTNAYYLNDTAQALQELAALHANLQIDLSNSAISGNEQVVRPIVRPWVEEPEGTVPYDEENKATLGAVGDTNIILSFQVPIGYDGVIKYLGWYFAGGGFVDGSGDLVLQILHNSTPIKNFSNITVQKGTPRMPKPVNSIRIYSGETITMTVKHAANALLVGDVVGNLVGYFYPAQG